MGRTVDSCKMLHGLDAAVLYVRSLALEYMISMVWDKKEGGKQEEAEAQ
jgi:hypothetical protein